MANEARLTGSTGMTVYALVRNASNQVWRPASSAFEAYNSANYANYATAISLTEQGATGVYAGSFPTGITTPGTYYVDIRKRVGGSAAVSDTPFGEVVIEWDGTSEVTLSDVTTGGATLYGENGSIEFTYTVYDTDGTTPLPDVAVFVSADSGGTQRSQTKLTDAFGKVIFNLNAGTVYFWRSHPTRNFTDPDTENVS